MKLSRIILGLVILVLAGAGGFYAYAWRSAIPSAGVPQPESFSKAEVERGAVAAALGDCNTCHTAPNGKPFAGGVAFKTPFGTIYSTNITPDSQTGIGGWTLAAFQRAMRKGVRRDGNYLYPAFPYDHFTKVDTDDTKALYAFLMTREPVRQEASANHLMFPLNHRFLMAGWNALFLNKGPYKPDPAKDETWNHGAYLVEGLGHCSACHTPRNAFGAEDMSKRYAGAPVEGWYAYRLNSSADAHVPWSEDAIYAYLRNGWHGDHGLARGPMAPVVENLATVPDSDVHAIAHYVASIMGVPTNAQQPAAPTLPPGVVAASGTRPQSAGSQTLPSPATGKLAASSAGAAIYAASCATCHEAGRAVPIGGIDLKLSTAVTGASPDNLIHIILAGVPADGGGQSKPIMPGFGVTLSDPQVAALASYLRERFGGDRPAWGDIDGAVSRARSSAQAMTGRSFASNSNP